MWSFTSTSFLGRKESKKVYPKPSPASSDDSDDESSSNTSHEEKLECPICWESFNIVENIPYVLWCGHTLCKNCVLGLKWAVVKFPTIPVHLPLFVSCPWCQLLSFRLVYKGNLKFPCKNYFLLWMVESMNGNRIKSHSVCGDHQSLPSSNGSLTLRNRINLTNIGTHQELPQPNRTHFISNLMNPDTVHAYLRKSLAFFLNFTAKFPLIIVFLLIVLYAIPASVIVLALYIILTVLFALPSVLVLYFAYPSLDWLVREILT